MSGTFEHGIPPECKKQIHCKQFCYSVLLFTVVKSFDYDLGALLQT